MRNELRCEAGQSVIEVLTVGLILLVPLMWLLGLLSQVHAAALAATSAVREAGLDAARAGDLGTAQNAVDEAVARAFVDEGLDPARALVRWDASSGLERGSSVEVEVSYPVPVVSAPFLGSVGGPSLHVRASHIARVDPYASRAP